MSAFNVKDTKFHIRPRPGRGELTELQCFLQTALLDFRGPTSILESLLVSFPQILVPATINFEITFDLIVCTRTSVAIEHVPDWRWERGVCLYVGCFHVPKPIIQTWKLTTKTANKTTYADHTKVLSHQQNWQKGDGHDLSDESLQAPVSTVVRREAQFLQSTPQALREVEKTTGHASRRQLRLYSDK